MLGRDAMDFIHKEDHLEFQKNLQFDANTAPTLVSGGRAPLLALLLSGILKNTN